MIGFHFIETLAYRIKVVLKVVLFRISSIFLINLNKYISVTEIGAVGTKVNKNVKMTDLS